MTRLLALLILISAVTLHDSPFFAAEDIKRYQGTGEVLSVDPLYGQITIKHGEIKGFVAGGDETVFFVSSKDLLKMIHKQDFVDFSIVEVKGDARIDRITKTGVAPDRKEGIPMGEAVQGVLTATGEMAKAITAPIEPAHEVVSGTTDATTNTTGAVLDEATFPKTKKKF